MRVLTVGDVNMDIILTGLQSMPVAEKETLAQGLDILVGGQAATVARAMARLGLDVSFVGRVGDDEYGRRAVGELSRAGVDVSAVIVDPCLRTGATVVLSTGAERAFATFAGCASAVRRTDVTPDILSRADHLHVGSYYLQERLRPEIENLFQDARQLGLTTSLDPGCDPLSRWGDDIFDVLPYVDVFLPNEAEAKALTGAASARKALDALAELSGTVVIKMGGRGCIGASGKRLSAATRSPRQLWTSQAPGTCSTPGFSTGSCTVGA